LGGCGGWGVYVCVRSEYVCVIVCIWVGVGVCMCVCVVSMFV